MTHSLPTSKLLTVLIVDDEATVCEVLCDLLTPRYDCYIATSAESARVLLQDHMFDLAFLDISLPGESGMDLAGFIKQQWPDMVIIFITALTDEHYLEGAKRLNAYAYLAKPFDIQIITELLGYVEIARQPMERPGPSMRTVDQVAPAMTKAVERAV